MPRPGNRSPQLSASADQARVASAGPEIVGALRPGVDRSSRRSRRAFRFRLFDGRSPGAKSLQALRRTAPTSRDGRLKALAREGEHARAGERAEKARRDDAAVFRGEFLKIRAEEALGAFARRVEHRLGFENPHARHHLLDDGEGAMRGCNQRRAVGCDESALHGAPGLHEFRRKHDIDVARRRHQREDGRAFAFRNHLDIVDRRAGALRDARHRGRLRIPAVPLGEVDDPVSDDAAALARRPRGPRA